jgi:poly(A) polymerase
VRATQRLISRGFEAYLVGGCVRDLLLGRPAKDYDIATGARPQQVKRVFPRNCRIIGRRFKLAHLHFHDNTKILECSTFRTTPQVENGAEDDLLITRDNEFGTAEEDALRRDFTVNALFLDPTSDKILDWTNGLDDLHARVIRTIGDPRVRFREDPVRILRAAKFAGRLGFSIEPETFAAMAETSCDLVRAAPPRVLEEILRLLRGVGALRSMVPVLADFLQGARHEQRVEFWRLLEALDLRVQGGHVPQNAVLLGVLLVCPVLARVDTSPGRSPSSIAEELLGPLSLALRLPRRDAGCLKRICGVQHRFLQPGKRFRVAGFVQGPYFEEALELFELRTQALGQGAVAVDEWQDRAERGGRHAAVHDDEDTREHDGDLPPDADGGVDADEGDPVPAVPPVPPVRRRAPRRDEPDHERHARADAEGDASGDDAQSDDAQSDDAQSGEASESGAGESGDRPGRRRRRRRRRGRGHGDETPADTAAQADTARDNRGHDAASLDESMPAQTRLPFGDRDDADDDRPADDSSGEPGPEGGSQQEERAQQDQPRGRRRRRRGRRGGRHGEDERFPTSDAPAPHGEAVDAGAHHDRLTEDDVVVDPESVDPERVEAAPAYRDEGFDAAGTAGTSEAPATDEGGREGGRRRRRRGRRGRSREGRGGEGQGGEPRQQKSQQQQQPRQQQQQQQRPGGQRPQRDNRGRDGRRESREHRRRGAPTPRDVDVVPRYRDRRGKVDVIEPAPLDLSAFDVELDPKRVPTFGSIVEGQGRPKRRGPRVPQDGVDDYKPPPPPGSGPGPSAPPPPPPSDDPDTFGDW